MLGRLEERLQEEIDRIQNRVITMGRMAERALKESLKALKKNDRQLAYYIILRDQYIDEMEIELDRLCQEFLVREQPVAGNLRFVYACIKINNELERVGDYAESIARQFLIIHSIDRPPLYPKINKIANIAIPMLGNALKSFAEKDPDLARSTMKKEKKVDNIRHNIREDLVHLWSCKKLSFEALPALMAIANRFERVADQACNICEEVLYMCTGETVKHKRTGTFRVLFIDDSDSCRSQMALGIGKASGLTNFIFSSGGTAPQPIDQKTVRFMSEKGIDISQQKSQHFNQVPNYAKYEIIIALCKEAEDVFPPPPTKTVSIRWHVKDPSKRKGSKKKINMAYEKTFKYLNDHIRELTQAIVGNDKKQNKEKK